MSHEVQAAKITAIAAVVAALASVGVAYIAIRNAVPTAVEEAAEPAVEKALNDLMAKSKALEYTSAKAWVYWDAKGFRTSFNIDTTKNPEMTESDGRKYFQFTFSKPVPDDYIVLLSSGSGGQPWVQDNVDTHFSAYGVTADQGVFAIVFHAPDKADN